MPCYELRRTIAYLAADDILQNEPRLSADEVQVRISVSYYVV